MTISDSDAVQLGNDLFMASQNLDNDGQIVISNLFASGTTVNLKSTVVGADAFVFGNTLNVTDMQAKNNLMMAGNNITISGTTVDNLIAGGNNLDISVEADGAFITGNTVFLKGDFTGDVTVSAQSVVIDPYLVVEGTLTVKAQSEPSIASTAKISKYNYEQLDANTSISFFGSYDIGSTEWIMSLVKTLISMLVIAIVMLLLLRTETTDATGKLTRNRPVAILLTGLLGLILLPVIFVLLCLSIILWPLAFSLLSLLAIVTFLSIVYTAIAFGRTVLKRVNKWVTSIIFVILFALLMSLPFVSIVLAILCLIFATGSLIQGWWVWRRGKSLEEDGDEPENDEAVSGFTVPRGTQYEEFEVSTAAPAQQTFMPSGMAANPVVNDADFDFDFDDKRS